jgi:2'-5' RNA ligase
VSLPRLFVAAWPPAGVLDLLETLPRPSDPGVRWTRRDQWHVTLRFLGAADPAAAVAALASLDVAAAEAVLGPLTARLGQSVVVVPVAGLTEVAVAVAAVTAEVGEPPDPRPFAGHLTLARLRQRPACGVTGFRLAARFAVRELHLVRSHLDHEGARYETLAVVPLREGPGAPPSGTQGSGAQDSGAGSSRSDAEFMQ